MHVRWGMPDERGKGDSKRMSKESCSGCSSSSCKGTTGAGAASESASSGKLQGRLKAIRNKVVVMSGKGGVGKSTVAVGLAAALAARGREVGLLDIDIHGPTTPRMLGVLEPPSPPVGASELQPVTTPWGVKVVSVHFFMEDPKEAIIWRGPLKAGLVKQFLEDVEWGELDYLVVDSPPGTGDEVLTIAQYLAPAGGRALLVTTPQQVATDAVVRSIRFCRRLELPMLGLVENMSGFVCPACGEETALFGKGGGEEMAAREGISFLGRIPLYPELMKSLEEGRPLMIREEHPARERWSSLVDLMEDVLG